MPTRPRGRAWRRFSRRQTIVIDGQLATGDVLSCPCCAELLEAEPTTRLAASLPLGARGFDLACRTCRRFFPYVWHTPASIQALRLRRFAAAVLRA